MKRLGVLMAGLVASGAVAAAAGQIAALNGIAPGEWQLTEIGGTEGKSICLADTAQLLQLQHGSAKCTRRVLDNGAKVATVHYTCPGGGNGRTTLTVRTASAVKIETQGMTGGAPFAVDYDARRLGDCPTTAPVPEPKPDAKGEQKQ